MPEGDTVFRAASTLHRALAGEVIRSSDLRVPRLALVDLSGQEVGEVASVGKHLLLRTDGGWTLRSHLRMEGSWHLYRPGERWRGPDHQVRAVLVTDPWVAVGFRLAMLELVRTSSEDNVVGHLGPDLLSELWDPHEAVRRLLLRPERPIGEALLDQRNLAGIGNLYRNEVLFLRGVNPWTPVGAVADLEGLVELARRLLQLNTRHWTQATTGDTKGERHWVFERQRGACLRCGTAIEVARQGPPPKARLTYWCPSCQATRAWTAGG
ncbi:MAG: Fpg/Nei family DNA glycosylase [Actinomycetota bacterium]